MSMPRAREVTCPKCGTVGTFTRWESLTIEDDNPELKELFKTGELFSYECKKCGESFKLEYDFLYHDVSNHFQIWYLPKHDFNIYDEVKKINANIDFDLFDEEIRMVDERIDLNEKIAIFENNLSDYIVEIIKEMFVVSDKNNVADVHFLGMKEGNLHFSFTKEKSFGFPYENYIKVLDDYEINAPHECLIVNSNTVHDYLKAKEGQ